MQINGISILSGFALNSKKPLDSRTVVDNYSNLSELVNAGAAYVGMMVYVNSTDEQKVYICKDNTGNGVWEAFESGQKLNYKPL